MRKTYITLFTAILLTLVGCKKETGEQVTVTFDAQLSQSHAPKDAKGIMVYLDDANKPCWTENDAIRVNDGDGTVTNVNTSNASRARFSVTMTKPEDHTYFAVYPASIGHHGTTAYDLHSTPKVYLPRVQEYEEQNGQQVINAPMFAYNREQPTLQFHNLCGLMKITVTNDKAWDMILDSIQVEATQYKLWGEMDVTNPTYPTINSQIQYATLNAPTYAVDSFNVAERQKNTVSLGDINATLRSSELADNRIGISDNPTSATYYIYLPTIPSQSSNLFYIRIFSHPVWKTATNTYTPDPEVHISYEIRQTASTNAYVERNSIIPINLYLSNCSPTFTSLKAFSVANGTQVSFSRGQAQYYINTLTAETNPDGEGVSSQTSTGYWRFSPRQWDFLYMTSLRHNSNTNDYHTGRWIEHFTWDSGNWPIHHWKAASDVGAYNTDFQNWSGDWGKNFTNKTSNTTWFTLEQTQYNYLLKERTRTAAGNSYNNKQNFAWVDLTNVTGGRSYNSSSDLYGIIIVPDDFVDNNENDVATRNALSIPTFKYYHSATIGTGNDVASRRRNDNTLTKAQFEYYEAKGCILMPCFGVFNALGSAIGPIDAPTYLGSVNYPEGDYWSKTDGGGNDAYMLQLEADHSSNIANADCRTSTGNLADGEKYRKFMVRLVRTYSQGGGNYKYDPFQ